MHQFTSFLLALLLLNGCSKNETPDNNNEELPTLSITGVEVEEGSSTQPVYLNVRLSKAATEVVTVTASIEPNTATTPDDFTATLTQELTFAAGDVQEEVRVDIVGDEEFEENESLTIRLSNAQNAEIADGEATIVILNDDNNTNIAIPSTGFQSPTSYPNMELIWQDEFEDGQDLTDNWKFEIGTGNNGWGNEESQFYRKENAFLKEGHLVIEARKENFGGRSYTSSRMITSDSFDFQYGRVDIRAALPRGQGIWPALWMLGSNFWDIGWPQCGEIDIMELLGHLSDTVYGSAHWSQDEQHTYKTGETKLSSGNFNEKFHVFSLVWTDTQLEWLVDNEPYHTLNITPEQMNELHNNFFIIFNVAVGGRWPGYPDNTTAFPQQMIVDYIRVFQ